MKTAELVSIAERSYKVLIDDSVYLLKKLITCPSFSGKEEVTANVLQKFLEEKGLKVHRKKNNVWVYNKYFKKGLPLILLNSHHDTVRPNSGYTLDPFHPDIEDGKLYGLGSTDAGGALVSLIAAFLYYAKAPELNYNIVLACTAEEEISGADGLELILPELGKIDFAIIGEPTEMHMAIAEKGLLVLDITVYGKAGHAARHEGENAIYKAMKTVEWFRNFRFPRVSSLLGPVHMNVTGIKAGIQHNIIPDRCELTVDIRVTDKYTHEEIIEIISEHTLCDIRARSLRLKPSFIDPEHPIVQSGIALGRKTYGSPTLSDQALLSVPSVKMGPGDSSRSHTADEFILISEISEGIRIYIELLKPLLIKPL